MLVRAVMAVNLRKRIRKVCESNQTVADVVVVLDAFMKQRESRNLVRLVGELREQGYKLSPRPSSLASVADLFGTSTYL